MDGPGGGGGGGGGAGGAADAVDPLDIINAAEAFTARGNSLAIYCLTGLRVELLSLGFQGLLPCCFFDGCKAFCVLLQIAAHLQLCI